MGYHKKQDDGSNHDASPAGSASGGQSGSLIELTTHVTAFNSNPVDASSFDIPAGLKPVDEDLIKQGRQR
jgi:hypothetical protein